MKLLLPPLFMIWTVALAVGENFEAPTYNAGQGLPGAWQAEGLVEVSTEEFVSGNQALKVGAEGRASFGSAQTQETSFVDLQILPVAAETEQLNLNGARLGFDSSGRILIFEGASSEGRPARNAQYSVSNGAAEAWVRVSVRIDPVGQKWDLFIDGQPAEANLALATTTQAATINAPTGSVYVDDYSQTGENPLFLDLDKDGLPDAEEKAHGLNPFADDRGGDIDGDGLSNVEELFAGSSPQAPGVLSDGSAPVIYVDNLNGNDGNSGKKSYGNINQLGPKASLKAAMAAAPNGATIVVLEGRGVYEEGSRSAEGKVLTIMPVDPVTIR